MKKSKSSPRRIATVFVCVCIAFLFCILAAAFRANIHRLLWNFRQPYKYQMVVGVHNAFGSFEKMICVVADEPIAEQLLSGQPKGDPRESSLTMPELFNLAGQCNPIDFYCIVDFDSYYHYPKYIEVYEGYSISTKISVIDGNLETNCPNLNN